MPTHELKTDPEVFEQSWNGYKQFEMRRDDRNFQTGDNLVLRETKFSGEEMANGSPLIYTGREITSSVAYILRGPFYGLPDGWVIMTALMMSRVEGAERAA